MLLYRGCLSSIWRCVSCKLGLRHSNHAWTVVWLAQKRIPMGGPMWSSVLECSPEADGQAHQRPLGRPCRTKSQIDGFEDSGGPIMVFFWSFPQNSSTTPLDAPETEGIVLKCLNAMIRVLNTLSEFHGWTIAKRGFLVRARMFCVRKNISNMVVWIPNRVFFITKYPKTSNLAGIHLSISGFLTLANTLRYTFQS